MIRIRWVIVSKGASIDRTSNELSLFSIIPAILPVGLPLLIQQCTVAVCLHRDTTDSEQVEATLRIKVNGHETFSHPVAVDFQGTQLAQSVIGLQGLVITEPGVISFDVSGANIESGECNIPVHAPPTVVGE